MFRKFCLATSIVVAATSVITLQSTKAEAGVGQECNKIACNLPNDNCVPFTNGDYCTRIYGPVRSICGPGAQYSYCSNGASLQCFMFQSFAHANCADPYTDPFPININVCSAFGPDTPTGPN
jgi:hypothetical protein